MAPPAYTPPPWSAAPGVAYSLEVVREGVVIETIDISQKAFYVVGRDPSSADVVLPHPSVSRTHAIIQHRESGEVYLFDNGSTHGSKLNRKPVPPHQYVRLSVGAVVRIGTGTRTLMLMGPEGGAAADAAVGTKAGAAADAAAGITRDAATASVPDAVAKRLQQRADRIAAQTGRSRVRAEDLHTDHGAGWGFSADAHVEARDRDEEVLEEMPFETLYAQAKESGLNMTPRQQRLVEQLERRTEKLRHLSTESERISAKEIEGLSEGQTNALKRNEERSGVLRQEIETLQEQIGDSIREQLGAQSRRNLGAISAQSLTD